MKKKECPSCAMEVEENNAHCPICGYEFAEGGSRSWLKWLALILLLIILLYWIF